MKEINTTIYGKQAREIEADLGLVMSGDAVSFDAVVHIRKKSVEGRAKMLIRITPSTGAVCSVCLIDGEQVLATNYYYPDIDKDEKVYVCDGHISVMERKGFVIFNDTAGAEI